MTLYPLLLKPSLHVKVWGGRKLETVMNKTLPTDEPYGESWELHDSCVVENGPHAGKSLKSLIRQYGQHIIGEETPPDEGMPLLAKLIDASDWLSVQVHPNDEQARELEGDPRGKTEAWIILSAEPGAKLVIGVQPGTSREAMAQAIRGNTLEDLLVFVDVQAGDVLYIPANTIHAIGPGLLIYEIQQSSDATYRLYDWGRMGLDGKPRELHVEKGVQVANVETLPEITHPGDFRATTLMVAGEYFITALQQLTNDTVTFETVARFHALTCIEGIAAVYAQNKANQVTIPTGRTVLIPAAIESYTLSGPAKVLRSFQPELRHL